MRDKDTKILEERYESIHSPKIVKEAGEEFNFTSDEVFQLEDFGEYLKRKTTRDDQYAKINIDYNVVGNSANFMKDIKHSVDTQVGTKWEDYSNSASIEKIAKDFYSITINSDTQEVSSFEEAFERLKTFLLD